MKRSLSAMSCRHIATPGRRCASSCLASPPSWTSGGKASSRIWSHSCSRPCGGAGCTSACSRSSIGNTKRPTHVAREEKPRFTMPWRRCKPRFTRMPSPSSWPLRFLRIGKRGPPSGRRPFSVHHRPWKGAMAICRKCIRTIGACPGADTRCGRFYTTLIVALRMVRRQHHAFAGGRSRISLKPCYPTSRPSLNRGGENTK